MSNENQCRVLLVDDDRLVREVIKSLLTGMGAEVVGEAGDGVEALSAFDEHKPDITFLDIQMPRKNGIEVLEELIAKDPDAIVVMLTADSDMEIADKCIDLGAQKFVRKGAAPSALAVMLKAGLDLANTA